MLIRLLFVAALAEFPGLAPACSGAVACPLGVRSYHVLPPDNWDGATALPVLLYFHGRGRQGDLVVKHDRTRDFWRAGSTDVDFAAHVIGDAARHYPIDRSRIYVGGYCYGAAVAWR